MSVEGSFQELATLRYWVKERELVRIQKEAGQPKPWTLDSILQQYRFCNVHREDDTVTRWIRNNWSIHVDHPNYLVAICMARYINWPDSLQDIGFPEIWDPHSILEKLVDRSAKDLKVWTSAYIVSTNGMKKAKAPYIVENVLNPIYQAQMQISINSLCESTAKRLLAFNGVQHFMAAQIVADLKNTPGHPLYNAADKWTWCYPGPGSVRGLNRLHGKKVTAIIDEAAFRREVNALQKLIDTPMDAQDMQNCLCEFDKYMRVKLHEGRPRQTYKGT